MLVLTKNSEINNNFFIIFTVHKFKDKVMVGVNKYAVKEEARKADRFLKRLRNTQHFKKLAPPEEACTANTVTSEDFNHE